MNDTRDRWNRKHCGRAGRPLTPDPFVVDNASRLPRGRVLDLASGDGRNSLFLAEQGFEVEAVDISKVAIDRLTKAAKKRRLPIRTLTMDLESSDLSALIDLGLFCAVIAVNYKPDDTLLSILPELLEPGGMFLWCTFNLRHHERTGFSARFCVNPGQHKDPPSGFESICFVDLCDEHGDRDGYLWRR